jgi:hypothetical protein
MDNQQIIEQIKWMIANDNPDHEIEALLVAEGVGRAEARKTLALVKNNLFPDEYPAIAEPPKRRNYLWIAAPIIAVLILLFVLRPWDAAKSGVAARELTTADMIRLIDADPGIYTTELNKIDAGWAFDQDKNRWSNKKRNSAIAIRMNELMLMKPTAHNTSFQDNLESQNYKKVIDTKPADGSKIRKEIYENDTFMFTIQTDEHYTMISLAHR